MAAPSKENTEEELIEIIRSTPGNGRQFEIAKFLLETKSQEKNQELQARIADESAKLNSATWTLAFATIGLVLATIGLILVTIKK